MRYLFVFIVIGLTAGLACKDNPTETEKPGTTFKGYIAPKASDAPVVDGVAAEDDWNNAEWYPIDQLWLGNAYTQNDFNGRFKVLWTEQKLYVLVEITDDKLTDSHSDPLVNYWDDDCLEVFIDEDKSADIHQYNYSAFAYHIALNYNAVDIGSDRQVHLFNDHVDVKRTTTGNITVWECGFLIYDETFVYGGDNTPVTLSADKIMGFMVAYCDSDNSTSRENFIGSVEIKGNDKNLGWVNAGVFGSLKLVD
ncbi:CBM9 family sugar-binding protein [candidate division KSB1 bacterium]|nr:CBM9 family sugar-binding protein [candidate division KSB1 bacterium]